MNRLLIGMHSSRRGISIVAAGVILAGAGAVLMHRRASHSVLVAPEMPGGKVRRISGDRLKLKDGRDIELAAIRLPFEHEPCAGEARRVLAKWCSDKGIRLEFDESHNSKKNRLFAYVEVHDESINERLVREGLAFVKLRAGQTRHKDNLLQAQASARENQKGLWRAIAVTKEGPLLGDLQQASFHLPRCAAIQSSRAYIDLKGNAQAFERGLAPCGACKPCESVTAANATPSAEPAGVQSAKANLPHRHGRHIDRGR